MTGPIRLGRIHGIPIAVDWSWSVISLLMAAAFYLRVAPEQGSSWPAVVAAAAGAVLLVASVLVHELSHAVVAVRLGIAIRSVTLFVFGGYTEMQTEPSSPRQEFLVAGSGPAASVALGGALWLGSLPFSGAVADVVTLLAWINVAVALFNLLPGLPLDGGRLLRALAWRVTGDGDRASRLAGDAGRLLGALVGAVGLAVLVVGRGVPGAALLLLVGWFVHRLATMSRRTAGRLATPVGDVMLPAPPGIAADGDAGAAAAAQAPIPVVAASRVVGTVEGPVPPGTRAAAAMTALRPADVVDVSTPIGAVLMQVLRRRRPLVVVAEGRMVGVIPPQHAERWLAGAG